MGKRFLASFAKTLSSGTEVIAGAALLGVMVLVACDIVGRLFGHPVPGTYEVVSFAGGLVVGLAMPVTSQARTHVIMDIVVANVSRPTRQVLHVGTRLAAIALFLLMGYAMVRMGLRLRDSGEVTPILSLPFYLVTFAIAGACFIESIILACDATLEGGTGNE